MLGDGKTQTHTCEQTKNSYMQGDTNSCIRCRNNSHMQKGGREAGFEAGPPNENCHRGMEPFSLYLSNG